MVKNLNEALSEGGRQTNKQADRQLDRQTDRNRQSHEVEQSTDKQQECTNRHWTQAVFQVLNL